MLIINIEKKLGILVLSMIPDPRTNSLWLLLKNIINRPVRKLRSLLPPRSITYAKLRAACSRYRLPPGDLVPLDELEKSDRYYLLHQASQVGSIFKAKAWDQFWVCIIGLATCRRFLQAHGKYLRADTLDLTSLVPKGFLRKMEGEEHSKYRKTLISGINVHDLFREDEELKNIVTNELEEFTAIQQESQDLALSYRTTLNRIATATLIKVFFGATRGTPLFDKLIQGYRKLGPYGLVWNLGQPQRSAFAEIREALREPFDNGDKVESNLLANSITGKLSEERSLDDTMLGNLIYMLEMGRYDMAGLMRWLTKYAADHPALLERLAEEAKHETEDKKSFAKAFVLETLRTDQSERLTRIAQRDLVFEGYLIPRHTHIRLCLWESHHLTESFEEPFKFDPERFLGPPLSGDKYSPFGLDHHRCPLADIAIKAGVVFLNQLTSTYTLEKLADALPIRGAYHWEPASNFVVRLCKR